MPICVINLYISLYNFGQTLRVCWNEIFNTEWNLYGEVNRESNKTSKTKSLLEMLYSQANHHFYYCIFTDVEERRKGKKKRIAWFLYKQQVEHELLGRCGSKGMYNSLDSCCVFNAYRQLKTQLLQGLSI